MNQKTIAAAIGRISLVTDHALGRQCALQDVQDRLRQTAARPWVVYRLTERQIAVSRLNPFDGHCYGQQLFYVIFR